jgi:hypothetical protein
MNKIELAKTIGGIIVSVGVSAIVGNAIKITTPAGIGAIKGACMSVGAMVLSSMISEHATKYTETKIDEAVAYVKDMVMEKEPDEESESK